MELIHRINRHFDTSLRVQQQTLAEQSASIELAALLLSNAILRENKVLCLGSGASAAHAQYFSTALMNRYDRDRPGLPAINLSNDAQVLSAIARDSSWRDIYAKQVKALGQSGDILLILSDTQMDESIAETISTAHDRGLQVILIGCGHSGHHADLIQSDDIEIQISAAGIPATLEAQFVVLNCLCDLVDLQIFGDAT